MEEQTFKIEVYYQNSKIIEFLAKATSTQELREKYIRMMSQVVIQEGITVKVFRKQNDEWIIVEEHLF